MMRFTGLALVGFEKLFVLEESRGGDGGDFDKVGLFLVLFEFLVWLIECELLIIVFGFYFYLL